MVEILELTTEPRLLERPSGPFLVTWQWEHLTGMCILYTCYFLNVYLKYTFFLDGVRSMGQFAIWALAVFPVIAMVMLKGNRR